MYGLELSVEVCHSLPPSCCTKHEVNRMMFVRASTLVCVAPQREDTLATRTPISFRGTQSDTGVALAGRAEGADVLVQISHVRQFPPLANSHWITPRSNTAKTQIRLHHSIFSDEFYALGCVVVVVVSE